MDEYERVLAYARKVAATTTRPRSVLADVTPQAIRTRRLFGRSESSTVAHSEPRLTGWLLWSQHTGERLQVGDVRTRQARVQEQERWEIWLNFDGTLWFASIKDNFIVYMSARTVSVTLQAATPENLRQPDFKWNMHKHKPDRRYLFDNEVHWNQGSQKFDKPFLGVSIALNQLTK